MRLIPLITSILFVTFTLTGCASKPERASLDYETVATSVHRDTDFAKQKNVEAATLLEAGKLEDAERLLKQALSADVMFGPAHNNLGKAHFEQGRLYEAAWEFQQAVQLMPHQPEPRNNLGLVLEKAGRLDEAVASYDEALRLEPGNPQLIGNLARAKVRRGDSGEELRRLLTDLVYKETRTEWAQWARERLSRMPAPRDETETGAPDAGATR